MHAKQLPWKFSVPIGGWATMHIDAMSLYGVVQIIDGDADWDSAQIFTKWEIAKALFEFHLNEHIASIAEDGKVAWVESGRDCDCVEYSGRVHIVDATYQAYVELDERLGEWADGPYQLALCRVSETQSVTYESRDLVMEAHEDGHPHVIYSSFP